MENLTKVCSRCKVEKGVDEFHKNTIAKDGLFIYCKTCKSESDFKYHEANSEKRNEKSAKYREANPGKMKELQAKYREANPGKMKELQAKWIKSNPEKMKEANSKWIKSNPEKVKQLSANWRKRNPEKVKEFRERYTNELSDSYIIRILKAAGYPQESINNPKFIELKRILIKTKRLCKTKLQESK